MLPGIVTWGTVAALAALLGVYVVYLLAMAGVLAICGVPRAEIAKWALKQADRQRLTDLIRAGLGPNRDSHDVLSGSGEDPRPEDGP
jgi:hypothetical protein